jgi:Zn finger protein HypA/HybF involved in hydrogenase expression
MNSSLQLTNSQLLTLWESAQQRHRLDRALIILQHANVNYDWGSLTQLSIGTRNNLLLDIHKQAFGEELWAMCDCPACGENLEVVADVEELGYGKSTPATGSVFVFDKDGVEISFRPINSQDLASVSIHQHSIQQHSIQQQGTNNQLEINGIRAALLEQCILYTVNKHTGEPLTQQDYAGYYDELSHAIHEHDPIMLNEAKVQCPKCRHPWTLNIDIAHFLWQEIKAKAKILLSEVQVLSRHYGWSEKDILNMSNTRRRGYIEVVN